jgi:hypothetical protein
VPQLALIDRRFDFGDGEVFVFDVVVSESPTHTVEITESPVETGVSMADHAFAKPVELEVEVAVTDTPFEKDDLGTPSRMLATTWVTGDSDRRSVNAWAKLVQKQAEFAVFDMQIGLGLYRNMMIQSLKAKQDKDSGAVLRAEMRLHQVTFAETSKAIYPPRAPAVKKKAAPKKYDGHKESAPEPIAEDKAKSAAKALSDKFGVTR